MNPAIHKCRSALLFRVPLSLLGRGTARPNRPVSLYACRIKWRMYLRTWPSVHSGLAAVGTAAVSAFPVIQQVSKYDKHFQPFDWLATKYKNFVKSPILFLFNHINM